MREISLPESGGVKILKLACFSVRIL